MNWKFFAIAGLGALTLTLLFWLTGFVINFPQGESDIIWDFLANYLVALVLGYYVIKSVSSSVKLSILVFLIYFIIGHFNLLIEAYIFNITNRMESSNEIIRGLLVALVFCPLYVYMFKFFGQLHVGTKLRFKKRPVVSWVWRILTGDFIYLFFYIGAGLILSIASPAIMEFYEGKIPPFGLMIKTQIFLRGFLFVFVAIIILRTMNVSLTRRAIFTGLVFTIIGAIAPLIPSNELMPVFVRLGHGIEVSLSNFIYGLVLGYLLGLPNLNVISGAPSSTN